MRKSKILSLVFGSLAGLSVASCQNAKTDISIFIYDYDTFITSLVASLRTQLDAAGLTYGEIHDAKLSQTEQNAEIVEAIDNDSSSLLLVNMVDRLSSSAIIEKASKKNKPIIFFNREPLLEDMKKGLDSNESLYYVGTDPYAEGQAQAEMLSKLFSSPASLNPFYDKDGDGVIQTVLLKGEIGHQDTEQRSNAVLESLAEKGYETEVLSSTYCDWSRAAAKESMLEIQGDFGGEIELIISNNDDMAIGAIDALLELGVYKEEKDFHQPFPIVGVDGTEVGLSYIERGLLYGTVENLGYEQADAITRLSETILDGKGLDSSFPYEIAEENHAIYCEGNAIISDNANSNFVFPES